MVGTDGYAPSTPRMSIEYSTIELSSHIKSIETLLYLNISYFFMSAYKIFIRLQRNSI